MGKNVFKPTKKNHYQPNLETEILEVKIAVVLYIRKCGRKNSRLFFQIL